MLNRAIGHVRRQPVAYLALFFAMSGTGIAAGPMITGKNVKAGSLTGRNIKKGSITATQIKDGSLLAVDFKRGQLPQGTKGDQGPAGAPGAPGAPGATNVTMRRVVANVNPTTFATAAVSCNPGERATGGGAYNESNVYSIYITSSYPTPNPTTAPSTGNGTTPTGWRVWVRNDTATQQQFEAYVVCAAP